VTWPIWHRHRWESIAAVAGVYVFGGGEGTVILQRCACGRVRTETINGKWSLQQLRNGQAGE
jgi:hypothetical protein